MRRKKLKVDADTFLKSPTQYGVQLKYTEADLLTAFGHGFNIGQRNPLPILDADSVLTIAKNIIVALNIKK
jgi:hypothetical protein